MASSVPTDYTTVIEARGSFSSARAKGKALQTHNMPQQPRGAAILKDLYMFDRGRFLLRQDCRSW